MLTQVREFIQSYFHGTKADLKYGDQIIPNHQSNYEESTRSKYVYLTSNLNAAIWGAELAKGEWLAGSM